MEAEAEAARVMGLANDYARQQLELQRTAALDLAMATGQMNQAQRDEIEIRHTAALGLGDYLDGLAETSAEALKLENRNRAIVDTFGDIATLAGGPITVLLALASAMGASVPTAAELTEKVGSFLGVIGKYDAAQTSAARATEQVTQKTKDTIRTQLEASAAKDRHTSATRDLRAELQKSAADKEAEAAAAMLQREATDLNSEVERIMAEEFARTATEAEKLQVRLLSLQEATASLAAQGVEVDTGRAQEVIAKQVAAAEEAARVKSAEDAKKAQEAQLAADIDFYAKRAEIATGAADVVAAYSQYKLDQQVQGYHDALAAQDALGRKATDAEKARAAEEVAEKRKQAMIAFLIDKAAKLAQALTATALATINALSMPPAPNYIAAGLAAAGGAVQVATIAAARPSFHSGGMADFSPDEASAVIRRGEAVLSPQGRRALGDDTIRAANAGMGSGQTIMVQQVYRHRVFDSFVSDNLRTRGPLSRALGSGGRAGQRRS
jgi:chemotaxis protein histidine kinase CheA